ncbi:MAG: metallophosphoesterase [Ignavibacteriae bacterium]|nr:metallophosphoesterase [Ignavibacteriota bacterium]MCB9217599.1 metallophosphoesterase [Ignavibacteria bacterium]
MNEYFSQIFSAIVLILLGGVNALLIWTLHRQWWKIQGVRRATWMVPLSGVLLAGLWALSKLLGVAPTERLFAFLTSFFFVSFIGLILLLPFSGITLTLERIVRWGWKKWKGRNQADLSAEVKTQRDISETAPVEKVDVARRSLITRGAAAFPLIAVSTGTFGLARSTASVVFPNVEMTFNNLPPDLDGLRILHISDLHLGYYIRLEHLEELLIGAEAQRPDLVLITGDTSDDLTVLPEALTMISQLQPRHGTFASLGNHEYYRGISDVLRIFDRGPVPLFVEKNTTLKVGRSELVIAAADDPAAASEEGVGKENFLIRSVEKAFDSTPSNAFHLLMSHRPEGFDHASAMGIDMTIAGHTHAGGQLGWNGRSFFETWLGVGKYLWGYYEKNGGRSKLYTSAGAGHWLPFRLGVPREVPVYTLRRGRGNLA